MEFFSGDEDDTQALARALAPLLAAGDVLCLSGDLGMGKSVFARALVRALAGVPDLEVPSPTFTLIQTYETAVASVWHFDLYRIKAAEDIYELGWEEALFGGITLVEWPERLEGLAPGERLDIVISAAEQGRRIEFIPYGCWRERINKHEFANLTGK